MSYLETAFLFAEQARILEDNPPTNGFQKRVLHGSLVTSSIISSAAALESSINEWFSIANFSTEVRKNNKLICDLWKHGIPRTAAYPILQKYQIALILSEKDVFDEGADPYQSARALVELRNWLVHYEPTSEPVYSASGEPPEEKSHKLYGRLKGRFPLNPLCAKFAPFWPYKCLGAGCAIWAAESVLRFVNAFFDACEPTFPFRIKSENIEMARKFAHEHTFFFPPA